MGYTYKFDRTEVIIPNETMHAELDAILKDYLENYDWDWDPTVWPTTEFVFGAKTYLVPSTVRDIVLVSADFDPRLDFTVDTTYNKLKRLFDTSLDKAGIKLIKREVEKPTYDPNAEPNDRDKKIETLLVVYQALPILLVVGALILYENIS